jgi:hypothetical protein
MSDNFMIYLCPHCGRTIKWPVVSTCAPNTICGPHRDESGTEFMVYMVVVWPPGGNVAKAPTEQL